MEIRESDEDFTEFDDRMLGIGQNRRRRIAERGARFGERDAMLGEVPRGLRRVPVEL